MRPKVSLCMIVKDGALTLPAAWQSVKELVDEWILIDTGSDDATCEIARQLAPNVSISPFAWNDDFAAARNQSLARATGDWILVMDADETLAEAGKQALISLFPSVPVPGVAYAVMSVGMTPTGPYHSPIIRVFARDLRLRYHGLVHEQAYLQDGSPMQIKALYQVQLINAQSPREKSAYYADLMERSLASPAHATPYIRYRYVIWKLESDCTQAELTELARQLEQVIHATHNGTPHRPGWFLPPLDLAVCSLFQIQFRLGQVTDSETLFARYAHSARHAEYFYSWGLARMALGYAAGAEEMFWRSYDSELMPLEPDKTYSLKPIEAIYQQALMLQDDLKALKAAWQLVRFRPEMQAEIHALESRLGLTRSDWLADQYKQIKRAFEQADYKCAARLAAGYLLLEQTQAILEIALQSYVWLGQAKLAECLSRLDPNRSAQDSSVNAKPEDISGEEWALLLLHKI